jgi:hypothetical protein
LRRRTPNRQARLLDQLEARAAASKFAQISSDMMKVNSRGASSATMTDIAASDLGVILDRQDEQHADRGRKVTTDRRANPVI